MKAFKKWLNSKFPDVEVYCPQCPEIAEESWKAALEWVLNQLEIEEDYDAFVNRIKKELEQ